MARSLAPDVVEPLLRGRLGRPYRYCDRCDSTQALLGPDDQEGAAAVCDEQTAGRGRLGRRWLAPPGTALLVSVLLRPPGGRRIAELSLVAGVAVANAVEAAADLSAQIKWPNDVMVDRRKVAGILAEARSGVVVLGVGVNVNQTRDELPPETTTPPGSLRTLTGREHDRAALLVDLLARLEAAYYGWRVDGLEAVYDELASRDFLRGRTVAVDGVRGVVVAVDRLGRLEVQADGERRLVESGEVSYLR